MKQTTNWHAKYACCIVQNPGENSTLTAANALAKLLSYFGSVTDIYVIPPAAGDPTTGGARYSQPEIIADGVPTNTPLCLWLDFKSANSPVHICNVGISVDILRLQPDNITNALVKVTGVPNDTVVALYVAREFPEVSAELNRKGEAVVAVEDEA